MQPATHRTIYSLLAEFHHPHEVVEASRRAYEAGYRRMEAYSPMPVEGLAEAMGFTRNRMPVIVFIGGLCGALFAYFMQWYTAAVDYPLIVAGKPYHSWPSFVPITFELTVLGAAFAAVFGMLALNGLPRPHHPVFNVPAFELASRNRFFLSILATDPLFEKSRTRQFLESLNPHTVHDVEC